MDELKEEIIKLIQDTQDERLLAAVTAYIKVLLTTD